MNDGRSVFLYGTLRCVPLLDVVLGRPSAPVPASLKDHEVRRSTGGTFPSIVPAPGHRAEGLLLTGLGPEDIARLDYYESAYHYGLRSVTVDGPEGPAEAEVFFPTDLAPTLDGPWSLSEWEARHGAAAVIAAEEVMLLYPDRPADEVAAIYDQIVMRAHSSLRAMADPAPARIRSGRSGADIEVRAKRRPYANFFTLAEEDLRFPLFGGGLSQTVTRAAFLTGDAVTVLPYDPVRDRVLLIEQFRYGPFMRGDPRPWTLEPVAGRVDPGETPEETARREAREEARIEIGALHRVAGYYPSPGAVTEYVTSFVGLADLPDGSTGIGGEAGEAEDIQSHLVEVAALPALLESGELANAPLILTVQWLMAHRDRLRAGHRNG